MKFARLVDNVIVDLVSGDPYEVFYIDIAKLFESVPDQVGRYWKKNAQGEFEPPPPPPPEPPPPPQPPTQAELDRQELLDHLSVMETDTLLPTRVRQFATKLRKVI